MTPVNAGAQFKVIVIGTSSGGLQALKTIFRELKRDFPVPVIAVQHLGYQSDDFLAQYLDEKCDIHVVEAKERDVILPGNVYIAPSDYHLLVEEDFSLSLSSTERVNYARPAIDVLFESAAFAFGPAVLGVILTGANADGARGIKTIKSYGGMVIVQDPATASADIMPRAALAISPVDYVLPLVQIAAKLENLCRTNFFSRE